MTTAALVAVALVALLHLYFLVLEMFLWTTPYGRRTFGLTPERAAMTRSLAANGAFTASRKILWVQAVPGVIALALVLLARARG